MNATDKMIVPGFSLVHGIVCFHVLVEYQLAT